VPRFEYAGQTESGAAFEGTIEAHDQAGAARELALAGVRVVRLGPEGAAGGRLSLNDLLFFNDQLATMTRAGIALDTGLRQLAEDVAPGRLRRLLLSVSERLAQGATIDEAIAALRHQFPPTYAPLVQAGLRAGDLGSSLYGLTAHLRLKSELRRTLIEVSIYPLIVLLILFAILTLLMKTVVPMFGDTFKDFGVTVMPAPTEALLALARSWDAVIVAVVVLFACYAIVTILLALPLFARLREGWLRRIPGLAGVLKASAQARFTHTSAIAAHTGTPLAELLESSGAASGSFRLEDDARRAAARLREGWPLGDAAADCREIPGVWVGVVESAETRGNLATCLEDLARVFEQVARRRSDVLRMLVGPLLMMFVGFAIGGGMLVLFLPLLNLVQSLAGP